MGGVLKTKNNIFPLLFLLALAVRLWGITHGFPFIYHPDEPTVVRTAMGLRFGDLNPHHFDWPHLQIYLSFCVFTVFIKARIPLMLLGLKDVTNNLFPILWDDTIVFYFLARLITAFMGASTVAILFLVGNKLYSKSVGILAALFLMFNLSHVVESHMATIDVPMVFWLTLSLLFAVNILKNGRLKDYVLAGLFAGLATSTKYNGGLSAVTILIAFLTFTARVGFFCGSVNKRVVLEQVKNLIFAAASTLFGFFLGTPYAFLDWQTFTRTDSPKGAFWQFYHVGGERLQSGHFGRLKGHLLFTLPTVQGLVLHLTAVFGWLLLLFRRRGEDFLILLFPLSYFLYVGNFKYAPEHFFLPLYPYLSLVAARFLDITFNFAFSKILFTERGRAALFVLGVLLVILVPLTQSLKADYTLSQKDTRTLAKEWIDTNLEDNAGIALGGDYEPILRDKAGIDDQKRGYRTIFLRDLFRGKSIYDSYFKIFAEKDVRYVVLGGFDLDRELKEAEWDPEEPHLPVWVAEKGELIKRFDPNGHPGPIVLIYKIPW